MEATPDKPKSKRTHTGPNRPGIKRRQKILQAAAELLLTNSFTEIKYSQIARLAGVPISSCYHYYNDSIDVFRALDLYLSTEFRRYLDFDNAYSNLDSWQEAIDIYLLNAKNFTRDYPVAGHMWFKAKIPSSALSASRRDRALSKDFETVIGRQFVLPNDPRISDVFYIAWEISEQTVSSIFTGDVPFDLAFTEAGKVMKAYLAHYLPEELPRRS